MLFGAAWESNFGSAPKWQFLESCLEQNRYVLRQLKQKISQNLILRFYKETIFKCQLKVFIRIKESEYISWKR